MGYKYREGKKLKHWVSGCLVQPSTVCFNHCGYSNKQGKTVLIDFKILKGQKDSK